MQLLPCFLGDLEISKYVSVQRWLWYTWMHLLPWQLASVAQSLEASYLRTCSQNSWRGKSRQRTQNAVDVPCSATRWGRMAADFWSQVPWPQGPMQQQNTKSHSQIPELLFIKVRGVNLSVFIWICCNGFCLLLPRRMGENSACVN